MELKSPGERNWGLKPQSILEHPVDYPQISRSSTFPFCWQSACLIFKPIYECFLPKSNLRPILGSHRSLWGPQKCNKQAHSTPIPDSQSKKSPCNFALELNSEAKTFVLDFKDNFWRRAQPEATWGCWILLNEHWFRDCVQRFGWIMEIPPLTVRQQQKFV